MSVGSLILTALCQLDFFYMAGFMSVKVLLFGNWLHYFLDQDVDSVRWRSFRTLSLFGFLYLRYDCWFLIIWRASCLLELLFLKGFMFVTVLPNGNKLRNFLDEGVNSVCWRSFIGHGLCLGCSMRYVCWFSIICRTLYLFEHFYFEGVLLVNLC